MPLFNQTSFAVYTRKFTKLKQGGTQYGKAPHKPVFLITLLELLEKQLITKNRVTITPELVATFKENFSLLVQTAHKDDFTQPFFYLQHEGFWFLRTKSGGKLDVYIRSVQTLSDRLDFGYFADDLFSLLTNEYARMQLKTVLLDCYFGAGPNTKRVGTGCVGKVVGQEGHHGLQHAWVKPSGGVIVEVNHTVKIAR